MAGFEPTNARVKVWCLTAWRHPNLNREAPAMGHTGYYSTVCTVWQSLFWEISRPISANSAAYSNCSLSFCLPHRNQRMSLRGGPPNVARRGTEGNACGAISCMADRHCNVSINIGNLGYTMLIGQYIVQILCWRLPRQSADWLAMTW